MNDDNLDDTQRYNAMVEKVGRSTDADIKGSTVGKNYCLTCNQEIPRNVDKHICRSEVAARNERENNRTWNAAIEAEAKIVYDTNGIIAEEIRKLKK